MPRGRSKRAWLLEGGAESSQRDVDDAAWPVLGPAKTRRSGYKHRTEQGERPVFISSGSQTIASARFRLKPYVEG